MIVADPFVPPTEEELLRMAGGTAEMIQATGKSGAELRSVLAQRVSGAVRSFTMQLILDVFVALVLQALLIKKKLKARAVEQKRLPDKKETFYRRELVPFLTGSHYHNDIMKQFYSCKFVIIVFVPVTTQAIITRVRRTRRTARRRSLGSRRRGRRAGRRNALSEAQYWRKLKTLLKYKCK